MGQDNAFGPLPKRIRSYNTAGYDCVWASETIPKFQFLHVFGPTNDDQLHVEFDICLAHGEMRVVARQNVPGLPDITRPEQPEPETIVLPAGTDLLGNH